MTPAELIGLVRTLIGEVTRFQAEYEKVSGALAKLRVEHQAVKDELARLKKLPPRPPQKPSGMDKATDRPDSQANAPKGGRSTQRRGSNLDKLTVTQTIEVKVDAPAGSRHKGYEEIVVQDLVLNPLVTRYRRERWQTPDGKTLIAPLDPGIVGGYGPHLQRLILMLHFQGQMTCERILALLNGVGVVISKRQVVRLLAAKLETFRAEDAEVLKTGLSSALGFADLRITPDPVRVASEGALWGAVREQSLLGQAIVVSDGAGQFRVGEHALCWVHAERLVHKLIPANDKQRNAIEVARRMIWWFYRALKEYKLAPSLEKAERLRAQFDRIFNRSRTGYATLDSLLRRLFRLKDDLLRVLDHPHIPLHTNASENDIRVFVTKRKISGGTLSDRGRDARDVMLGLAKTCRKLKIPFFDYLGARLAIPGPEIPDLATLVRPAPS